MSTRKNISAYLECVLEQIHWKRARPVVILELRQHLEDQRDAPLPPWAAQTLRNWLRRRWGTQSLSVKT